MKGIQISTYLTNLADLKVSDIPEPVPNDHEYLVEVRAVAANFFEVLQIAGKYQNQPLAKACGAKVIATASTAHKLNVAKSFGADYTVNYNDTDWPQKIKEITPGNRGVDIVFDPVGLVNASSKCTAWNGKILIIGFARGVIEMVPTNKVLLKNISLMGFHGEAYAYNERRTLVDNWAAIFGLIRDGKVRPMVFSDRDFIGLDAVKDAFIALADRETWGKVTVQIPKVVDSFF
ncbi:hypothetical protein MY5147_009228 [Beauveria neobassiana]